MKVGDVVLDRWDEVSYVIEINNESETAITLSVKPGRHQPTVYKVEDLTVISRDDYEPVKLNQSR